MDIRQRIGQRIRQMREALGQPQVQVAAALGITRQTLSRMEKGEVPIDSEALFRLAARFDRPVSYFYDEWDAGGVRLALRADHPQLLESGLRHHLLDKLSAIVDLEAVAGLGMQHGLPPTEPLVKAGGASWPLCRMWRRRSVGGWGWDQLLPFPIPWQCWKAWIFVLFPLSLRLVRMVRSCQAFLLIANHWVLVSLLTPMLIFPLSTRFSA